MWSEGSLRVFRQVFVAFGAAGHGLSGSMAQASPAPPPCQAPLMEVEPHDFSRPLTFAWRADGTLDLLSCVKDRFTAEVRVWRWANVTFAGVKTHDVAGVKRLMLETRDGPLDLGALEASPCMPQEHDRSPIKCGLLFGERTVRGTQKRSWSLSLTLGDGDEIASETRFVPFDVPEAFSREP